MSINAPVSLGVLIESRVRIARLTDALRLEWDYSRFVFTPCALGCLVCVARGGCSWCSIFHGAGGVRDIFWNWRQRFIWSSREELLTVIIYLPCAGLIHKVARADIAIGAEEFVVDLGHLHVIVLFFLAPVTDMWHGVCRW